MRSAKLAAAVVMLLVVSCAARAQTIGAKQVDDKTIRVAVPGRFETDFTLRKGFGATWFDLAHDPDKQRNLAPVADENGFFWIKNAPGPKPPQGGSSWYANPPQEMDLLESSPVRVRIRLKGTHQRYGSPREAAAWKELKFELTWTVYPTGEVFGDYALVNEQPVPLHHFLAIVKSTGAWGKNGKGPGANEIHPASEAGEGVRPGGGRPAAWVLQYSNGPTYFTDILMVFQDGKFGGTYWNEGFLDKDYRTGLNLLSMFPEKTVPAGGMHIPVMFRIADDMNDVKAAALYANAYRAPDTLAITRGEAVKDDEGDFDKDGYNEAEGSYVLRAGPEGAAFTLHGAEIPRMSPAFKIRGWKGDAPKTILMDGKPLSTGKGYNVHVADGTLLLQLLREVQANATVVIR